MDAGMTAPWHRESFDGFIEKLLPELLGERIPLAGYEVISEPGHTRRIRVTVAAGSGEASATYDVLQPDDEVVLVVDGWRRVVVPLADDEDLATANVRCVGEQLADYVAARIGEAPEGLPWDDDLLRAWLPLDQWVHDFLTQERTAQVLQETNWLDEHTHLRRVFIPDHKKVFSAGQIGRACPFEVPEGPNIGRIVTVALGARIDGERIVIQDSRPEAGLGLAASIIPFLEHDEPTRLLMGANMMRQWLPPAVPEPALVQTGNEPAEPGFWCGFNLLTALIPWGEDTFEDALVISESAARRMRYDHPVEPGDKLSNRHGVKGVISSILRDDEMPHLADGTPVELIASPMRIHGRLYFGEVLEAAMGRVARAEGEPAVVPPYHAPGRDELRRRLAAVGLPEDGMEQLTLGRDGPALDYRSTVGWIYWGRTLHVAQDKIRAAVGDRRYEGEGALVSYAGQVSGEMEYWVLRDLGAYANLAEQGTFRTEGHPDADGLASRVATKGPPSPAPPSVRFLALRETLEAAGIQADLDGGRVRFSTGARRDEELELAKPVPHPWLPEWRIAAIGAPPADAQGFRYAPYGSEEAPESGRDFDALKQANAKSLRLSKGHVPASLREAAIQQLETALGRYVDGLVQRAQVRHSGRVLFSGRTVIAPGLGLALDQLGVAEDIAWTLFGPLVARELGSEDQVFQRTPLAAEALRAVMDRSWVIVNRAPTVSPTAILAFKPVLQADRTIRLHPLACRFLNADYDGDQVAIFLPLTDKAQREAAELLSVAAHVGRDNDLIAELVPTFDAMWGLARLSLEAEGRDRIGQELGLDGQRVPIAISHPWLVEAASALLKREGVGPAIASLERLARVGFEAARASGASVSPFIGEGLSRPRDGDRLTPEAWQSYLDRLEAEIGSLADYGDAKIGPQLLAIRAVRLGDAERLVALVAGKAEVTDANGNPTPVMHSFAQGVEVGELLALAAESRRRLAEIEMRWPDLGQELRRRSAPKGHGVLSRAMRARRPGPVFARAAAIGEVDPLTDLDARLFLGLGINGSQEV